MTLGNVYDMDLKRNEVLIKEVIIQAQGEVLFLLSCHCNILLSPIALTDGTRGVHQTSQGNLDQLYARIGSLSDEMPTHQVSCIGA